MASKLTAGDLQIITRIAVFRGLKPETVEHIVAPATCVTLAPHATLFRQGDPATAFFIMIDGWVKLYRITLSGEETVIHILTKGDSFAEAVAFTGSRYPATAEAVSDARVVRIPADHVVRCIRESPDIALAMVASTSQHLHHLVQQVEQLKAQSGQFPLHTWLPDAMAGPTPVSSLLHSSTMVVAGVFLVARLYPVFHVGLEINLAGQEFNLIAVIGGITILIAALLAFVQNDIKRVLAYSTVSQLGYMMMGLGVGAWTAAVFHIFTHAFFKCCLFLCAGLGQPHRQPPQLRHEEGHGRHLAQDAGHVHHVDHEHRRARAASRSSPGSSRRTRSSTRPSTTTTTSSITSGSSAPS